MNAMLPVVFMSLVGVTSPQPVQRYAVIIAANHGDDAHEKPLQFAVSDARELQNTLEAIGNFPDDNVWVLTEPTPEDVYTAFASVFRRAQAEHAGKDSLLFVYYAGHADAVSLHLGTNHLAWPELIRYTRSTGLQSRVLVVDACRSGAAGPPARLTHVAGGEALKGLAIFASISADEDARESEGLQGALFTHHLLAAMQGVGDTNGDGKVTVYEALEYSAERTTQSYEQPVGGDELGNFRYRMSGNTDMALTEPASVVALATVHLAAPGTYVFRMESREGKLATQAVVNTAVRTIWLQPGRYFVQRRVGRNAYEGMVELASASGLMIEEDTLYPGDWDVNAKAPPPDPRGTVEDPRWSLSAGGGIAGGVSRLYRAPWTIDTLASRRAGRLVLDFQLGYGQGKSFTSNGSLQDINAAFGVRGAESAGPLTISLGGRVGVMYLNETRDAVDEHLLAPHLDGVVRVEVLLNSHVFLAAEGGARALLLPHSLVENKTIAVDPFVGGQLGFIF